MATTETDALDREDMVRLVGGHEAALNDLMGRHATTVFHFLVRMLGNEDDAHDLAQETFVRVFQRCSSFRFEAKFTTWLYTIAANLARNHHRWRSRHPEVSLDAAVEDTEQSLGDRLPAAGVSPREEVLTEERAAAVRAAVEALPDDMREAIILCEWEDLAVAEAADVLRTTPKAVEARLYRARKRLKERLVGWRD